MPPQSFLRICDVIRPNLPDQTLAQPTPPVSGREWFNNVDILYNIFNQLILSVSHDQTLHATRTIRSLAGASTRESNLELAQELKSLLWSPHDLASVCVYWKLVCHSFPSLWSHVRVAYFGDSHAKLRKYNVVSRANARRAVSRSPPFLHVSIFVLDKSFPFNPSSFYPSLLIEEEEVSYAPDDVCRTDHFWGAWQHLILSQIPLRSLVVAEIDELAFFTPPYPTLFDEFVLDIDGRRCSWWMADPYSPLYTCRTLSVQMVLSECYLFPYPDLSSFNSLPPFANLAHFGIRIPTIPISPPLVEGQYLFRSEWLNSVFDIIPLMPSLISLSFALLPAAHFRMGIWRRTYDIPNVVSNYDLPLLTKIRFIGVDTNDPFFGIYMPFFKLRSLRDAVFQEPVHTDFGVHLQNMGMLTSLEIALAPNDQDLILLWDALDRLHELRHLTIIALEYHSRLALFHQLADAALLPNLHSLRFRYRPRICADGHYFWTDEDHVACSLLRLVENRKDALLEVDAEVNGRYDGGPAFHRRINATGVKSAFLVRCGYQGASYSFQTDSIVSSS